MQYKPPELDPAQRRLKCAVAILVGLAVLALIAVGIIALARPTKAAHQTDTSSSSTEGDTTALSQTDVTALVEGRSAALANENESAYLKPFSGAAREAEQRIFRNVFRVPMDSRTLTLRQSSGRLTNSFGGGVTATVDVIFAHQITGVDLSPVEEGYRWTVEKKSPTSQPTITAVTGTPYTEGKGMVAYPAPWDSYGDLQVQRTGHVVLMSDSANAAQIRAAAPQMEQAATNDLSAWKANSPPNATVAPGFAVTIEPDNTRFGSLFGDDPSTAGREAGVTVTMATAGTETSLKTPYSGARIVMKNGDPRVARHEMTHAMLMPLFKSPLITDLAGAQYWLVEGFAEYMAMRSGGDDRGGAAALRQVGFDGQLPNQLTFYSGTPQQVAANYELGRLAMDYIAKKDGERRLFQLVAAQYADPSHLDQQILAATGSDMNTFVTQWGNYVRSVVQ